MENDACCARRHDQLMTRILVMAFCEPSSLVQNTIYTPLLTRVPLKLVAFQMACPPSDFISYTIVPLISVILRVVLFTKPLIAIGPVYSCVTGFGNAYTSVKASLPSIAVPR